MSTLNSVELMIEGNVLKVSEILDKLKLFKYYEDLSVLADIDNAKANVLAVRNSDTIRVFLNCVVCGKGLFDLIVKLSFKNPGVLFLIRKENDICFTQKQYKNGKLLENLEFTSLILWRLHTESMYLCSEDISTFLEYDLDYIFHETEDFNEYKLSVLDVFEEVDFTEHYTKDDLINDIIKAYNNLSD